MSDPVRPHRQQATRLHHPWDSPDKNTGMGCHFLLQCMKMKSESEVTQSYVTLSDPMDSSPPGSSIHGIFQARVLEWGAISFSEQFYILKTQLYIAFCAITYILSSYPLMDCQIFISRDKVLHPHFMFSIWWMRHYRTLLVNRSVGNRLKPLRL